MRKTLFSFLAFLAISVSFGQVAVHSVQKISNLSGNLGKILSSGDGFADRMSNIGDFDGDGIPDFAVSANTDNDGNSEAGAFYILLMNADGTVKSHHKISTDSGNLGITLQTTALFGKSVVSLGDLDGDGVTDLAVSAVGENDYIGSVYILYMNRNCTVKRTKKIDANTSVLSSYLTNSNLFGVDMACPGDINGDGIPDLAVGAAFESGNTGAVYILLLDTDGTVKSAQHIPTGTGGLATAIGYGGKFGSSMGKVGDINGDGIPDIVVGSQDDNGTNGSVYILMLDTDGSVKNYTKLNDSGQISSTSGYFGISVCGVPDLNGDGINDLLVGAGGSDAVYILYLDNNAKVKSYQVIDGSSSGMHNTITSGEIFGNSVASLPDYNGYRRIAAGARYDNDWASGSGAVFVLSLAPTYTPFASLLGHVTQSTGAALKSSEIYLVTYNPGDSVLTAVDSTITDSTGYYKFNLTSSDSVVYLYANPDSTAYPNQIPTYDSLQSTFQYAHAVRPASGTNTVNFSTIAGTNPGGTGFIGGKVTICFCKKAGAGSPVAGLKIILMNSGKAVAYTYTDKHGNFGFKKLAVGNYSVFVDRPLIDNTKAPQVDITAAKSIQQNLNFSLTPTALELVTTSIQNIAVDKNSINFYPNPAHDKLNINAGSQIIQSLVITDETGKEVLNMQGIKAEMTTVSVATLPAGIYIIKIGMSDGFTMKKFIKE